MATALGILILLGALLGPALGMGFDSLLPGFIIGAVWAIVGLKRGLPIVPTTGPEEVSAGVSKIRRRALVLCLSALACLPLAAWSVPRVTAQWQLTVFFLSIIPVVVAFGVWALSSCPRCGRHFFVGTRWWRPSSWHCQNCGMGLHET